MKPINEAFMLLAVGVGTVFLVLLLVILFSKLIVLVVNRFFPEKKPVVSVQGIAAIPSKTIAAITAAVNIAFGGKFKVDKIERSETNKS